MKKQTITLLIGILMVLLVVGAASGAKVLGVVGTLNPEGNEIDLANSVNVSTAVEEKLGSDSYIQIYDVNVTDSDKGNSSLLIVCYGGPSANIITKELVDAGKSKVNWANSTGQYEIIGNAFGNNSATAIIVAGEDSDATKFACEEFADYFEEKVFVQNASLNKEFTISIESNPSTGYEWGAIYDTNYLTLINETFIPGDTELAGAPGTQKFTFEPIKKGSTNIILNYQRSWEDSPIDAAIYCIDIT